MGSKTVSLTTTTMKNSGTRSLSVPSEAASSVSRMASDAHLRKFHRKNVSFYRQFIATLKRDLTIKRKQFWSELLPSAYIAIILGALVLNSPQRSLVKENSKPIIFGVLHEKLNLATILNILPSLASSMNQTEATRNSTAHKLKPLIEKATPSNIFHLNVLKKTIQPIFLVITDQVKQDERLEKFVVHLKMVCLKYMKKMFGIIGASFVGQLDLCQKFNRSITNSVEFDLFVKSSTVKNVTNLGVIINRFDDDELDYTLRLADFELPSTIPFLEENKDFSECYKTSPNHELQNMTTWQKCQALKYYTSSFLFFQSIIDTALLNTLSNSTNLKNELPNFVYGLYPNRAFYSTTQFMMLMFPFAFGYLLLFFKTISEQVKAKEQRLKNLVLWMGLSRNAYWFSWLVAHLSQLLVISLLVTWVMTVKYSFFPTSPSLFFLVFFLYGMTFLLIGGCISTQFTNSKFSIFGGLLYAALSYFGARMLFASDNSNPNMFYFLFFIPIVPIYAWIMFTCQAEHIDLKNFLYEPSSLPSSHIIAMLVIDCALYFMIMLLLDEYPISYFFEKFLKLVQNSSGNYSLTSEDIENPSSSFELKDSDKSQQTVEVKNLVKKFGYNVALQNVSLSLFNSEITAIVGANGAGKSTLIEILIGEQTPTSGYAKICNMNVADKQKLLSLRTQFGVCLQENVLFEVLTPEEHLLFFGRIKGLDEAKVKSQVQEFLQITGLDTKKIRSANLSGGQKRKLCIAIALIGESKIIFLDEPTSGVDPGSRQEIWKMLEQFKKNRTIILSTQFMDEADLLCDRKAFMFYGKIACVGTSMQLKSRYDVGFHVRIDLGNRFNRDEDLSSLKQLIMKLQPNAHFERVTDSEILLIIPKNEDHSHLEFFRELDSLIQSKEFDIKSYGLSMTTLEDVFMKLAKRSELNEKPESNPVVKLDFSQFEYRPSLCQRLGSFLKIRWMTMLREYQFIFMIIFHTALTILLHYHLSRNLLSSASPTAFKIQEHSSFLMRQNSLSVAKKFQRKLSKSHTVKISSKNSSQWSFNDFEDTNMAVDFQSEDSITLLFAPKEWEGIPTLQNSLTNLYLAQHKEFSNFRVRTTSEPVTTSIMKTLAIHVVPTMIFLYCSITLFHYVPSIQTSDLVEDRETGFKEFLLSFGLKRWEYWFVVQIVHTVFFGLVLSVIVIYIFFAIPKTAPFYNLTIFLWFSSLLALYSFVAPLIIHLLSFFFSKRETSESHIQAYVLNSSMIFLAISSVSLFNGSFSNYWAFVFPLATPQLFILDVCVMPFFKFELDGQVQEPLKYDSLAMFCFYSLVAHLVVWTILTIPIDILHQKLCDVDFFYMLKKMLCFFKKTKMISREENEVDEDVLAEQEKVHRFIREGNTTALITLNNVTRTFNDIPAVKSVTFSLESGQIFGLLGANGAGKTTVMRMLIGEINPTSGELYFEDKLLSKIDNRFKKLSYCPQINPLLKNGTLDEHLQLFATIRGVQSKQRDLYIKMLIDSMDLSAHQHKYFAHLSGGTKRKVCLLGSLMGNTDVILLDEPSTGLDPQAKRYMWNLLIDIFAPGGRKTCVLTTHSMEEVEALCTKTVIMKSGEVKCIGTIQHLKNKFAKNFIAQLKLPHNVDSSSRKTLQASLKTKLPNSVFEWPESSEVVKIIVDPRDIKAVSDLFEILQKLISDKQIVDYGIFQSSIEKILIDVTANVTTNQT